MIFIQKRICKEQRVSQKRPPESDKVTEPVFKQFVPSVERSDIIYDRYRNVNMLFYFRAGEHDRIILEVFRYCRMPACRDAGRYMQ